MIRWCSYCQAFMGEVAPFESARLTHGLCDPCDARMEAGEKLVETTAPVRDLMNRIFECSARGDEAAIPELLAEAAARSLPSSSVLVGLLQPALYRAGEAWRSGGLSIASAHRLVVWCDRFFSQLPSRRLAPSPLDLLIFVAPNNPHSLGPKFLAELLIARGLRAEVVAPELPVGEMVAEIDRLRPRVVGISCALPASLPLADAVIKELGERVDPTWPRRFLVGGFAVRNSEAPWVSEAGASVALTADDAERIVRA